MRITGGALARRTIDAPKGDRTRPTTDRVREALFNLLGARMELRDARVLDLFAGSGALGLEALSRGAAHVTFVERHGPTLAVARANARQLEVVDRAAFARADALGWLGRAAGPFDLVVADPPYALAELAALPDRLRPLLAPDGLMVIEHDRRHAFNDALGLVLTRAYGNTVISVFEG
ncbi:16S rRNA (guanine(966)-N(2))-methyltransferase RsmD [Rubrivirga sp. IMCC45206]|uniref:16S rRNA (guanine(966)-N(2))-methyltransferase RsmD n=1 Tax=Rubrivirga sp. IMCC45206 TaxID=3391614 RepID=UPI0039900D12